MPQLSNWRTTAAGVFVIVISALHQFAHIDIPGALELPQALAVGAGLILAKDA